MQLIQSRHILTELLDLDIELAIFSVLLVLWPSFWIQTFGFFLFELFELISWGCWASNQVHADRVAPISTNKELFKPRLLIILDQRPNSLKIHDAYLFKKVQTIRCYLVRVLEQHLILRKYLNFKLFKTSTDFEKILVQAVKLHDYLLELLELEIGRQLW